MNISKGIYDKSDTWSITKNGKKIGTLYSDGKEPVVDLRTRHHTITMDDLISLIELCEKEFRVIKKHGLW